jgi:beta-glucanase (GH16 family)
MDAPSRGSRVTPIRIGAALVVAVALSAGASACGSDSSSDSTATVEKQAGAAEPDAGTSGASDWQLTFGDDFDGPAGAKPDPAKWGYQTSDRRIAGNSQLQYYTDSAQNSSLDGDGNLVITAREETTPGSSCANRPCRYTSARIWTDKKFSQTYGRFEARVQVPSGKGIWPAFWMLGDDVNTRVGWPAGGEIDVMEIRGDNPSTLFGSLIGPGRTGGVSSFTKAYTLPEGQSFADGFHTFAVEWEPNVVRWYADDQLYATCTPADLPAGSRWVFQRPFFMILNLAVDGNVGRMPGAVAKFPSEMKIDYVRAYKRPEGAAPAN